LQEHESFLLQLRRPVDDEGERAGVFIGDGIEEEPLAIEAGVVIYHALAIGTDGRMQGK